MAWSPTLGAAARVAAQTLLLDGLNSRRKLNFKNELYELVPLSTPLTTILMMAKNMPVNDPEDKYYEHRPSYLVDRKITFAASVACSATNCGQAFLNKTISDATGILTASGNDKLVIQVVDGDDVTKYCNFLISNVDSTTQIDLIQLTQTPGFDVASGDVGYIIGSAFAEGAAKTEAYYDKLSVKYASCQIFKTKIKVTRTVEKLALAGGNEYMRLLNTKLVEHKTDIERALIFGTRVTDESGSNDPWGAPLVTALGGSADAPIRTTISIQQAAQYADSVGMGGSRQFNNTLATYDYYAFIDDMEELFEYGSESRFFFGGRGVLTLLNKMALDKNVNMQKELGEAYGVKYTKFITAHGDLKFVPHPLFKGTAYHRKAFAVDMNNIEYMVFDNTMLETHVETPGTDGREDQYLTDTGIRILLPEASVAEFNWS